MAKIKITPKVAASLPVGFYWDQSMQNFGIKVYPSGKRSWLVQYRVNGVTRRHHLSFNLSIEQAKAEAKKLLGDVARGVDPVAEKEKAARAAGDSFENIALDHLKREGKSLRSAAQRKATLQRNVFPHIGKIPIAEIRRSDVVRLLDRIEDERGKHAAQQALAFISKILNWHAKRSDDFVNPLAKGMSRTTLAETTRERTLTDAEIRALWRAAEAMDGIFGRYTQFLLLTACRRSEAALMRWDELDGDTWVIPAARMKAGVEHVVPLSGMARAILKTLPRISPYVFPAITNFGVQKRRLDAACGIVDWRLHDLRRSARSLLSRAGVNADVGERCLAHTLQGVRKVYDKHDFISEKRIAFEMLATQIDFIINPPGDNIVGFNRKAE
jgi:integrase